MAGGGRKAWTTLRHTRWHQWARLTAAVVLLDQALGTISGIPSSEAIVVAAIGALFAPVPAERREEPRKE